MPEYLLSIYQPDGGVPGAETMARITFSRDMTRRTHPNDAPQLQAPNPPYLYVL